MMADTLRVLYVDDEPDLLDIGKLFLEKGGAFAVDTLTSATVALELLNRERYDAIISDYQMPDMDGISFLKKLKASGNNTPFIIFTGRGREEVVIEALNEGADFYLQKGGEPKSQFAELAHKVRSAVDRKRTEKLAKDTERRLYDIINFLPDATFAVDTEGKVIAWNKAIEEMTGVPARDVLGKGDHEYSIPFYGDRRPILIDLVSIPEEEFSQGKYAVIKKEGGILIAETTLPHPRGRYSVLLGKASHLYNDEGNIIGAIESIRDITEQKQSAEDLRKAHDEYVDLLEHMNDVYYRSDTQGRLILASKSWAKDLGYDDLSECLGKNIADTFYADPGDRRRFLEEVYRNGSVSDYEVALKKKDGTQLLVATSSYLYFDKSGTVLGVEGTWRDITERKQAEETLRLFKDLVEHSSDAIGMSTPEGKHYYQNEAFNRLFGNIGDSPPETVYVDKAIGKQVFDTIIGGGSWQGEVKMFKADGTILDIFQRAYSMTDRNGHIMGLVGLHTDITERKRAEKVICKSEAHLKRAEEVGRSGSWEIRLNEKTVSASDGARILYGFTGTQSTIEEIQKVPLPEYRHLLDTALKDLITGKSPYNVEFKIRRQSDGTVLDIHSLAEYDPGRNAVFGVIHDITERKVAEDAHRKSEEQSRMLLSTIPDIVMVHQGGIIVYANQMAVEKTGYSEEELIGSHLFDRVKETDREIITRNMKKRAAGEPVGDYEIDMIHKSGVLHHVIIRTSPIVFNQLPSVVFIIIDITERKRAEDALRESELKYRSLIESSSDAIFCVDQDGEYKFTNFVFASTFDKTPDYFIGKTFWDIYPKEHADYRQRTNLAVFETGVTQTIEVEVPLPDTTLYFIAKANPIKDETGKVILNLTHATDITERKRAEEALNDNYLFMQTLIQTIPIPVFIKNRDGKYTGCNKTFETYFGRSRGEIIGRTVHEVSPKEIADEYFRTDEDLINHPGTQHYEWRAVSKNGQARDVIIDKATIMNSDGEATGIIGVMVDITERKRAEEALHEANKKLNLLSSITRHDINNQLTVLRGSLSLMEDTQLNPSQNQYYQMASTAAQRISAMIQFTREYEEIGVHAPIWQDCRSLVDTAAKQAPLGMVMVKNDLPSGTEVFADPLVVKVFYNLMDNAVRYGGKITTIRFSAPESGDDQVIVCEDDGDGIVAAEKEKIFERGFGKNTGLGLALSREILDITGITIRETGEPGKGARFEISVPKGAWRMAVKGD